MEQDTDIGGPAHRFPLTSQSAILGVRSSNLEVRRRAFETILESYWKPAYKYIRIKWQASNEDAKDLTQGFFAIAIEKNYFAHYDSSKASFQTYLRTCLDGFVANHKKSEQRLKRGGNVIHSSLDFAAAEDELALHGAATDLTPEDYFHREWIRSLFALTIDTLRTRFAETGREVHYKVFEAYDLREDDSQKLTYADLARAFALSTTDITNYLAAARRDFRKIVLEKLREITATEDEFQREARSLLGIRIE